MLVFTMQQQKQQPLVNRMMMFINKNMFVILLIITILPPQIQAQFNFLDLDDERQPLPCNQLSDNDDQLTTISNQCNLLRIFKQSSLDQMNSSQISQLAIKCACELVNMRSQWERDFGSGKMIHVYQIVDAMTLKDDLGQYPIYFWNDFDVTVDRVSIYLTTKGYFNGKVLNRMRGDPIERFDFEDTFHWKLISAVCAKVSQDPHKLYRYLENLARIDPTVFFRLVYLDSFISAVYLSSKACKLLILPRFDEYRLRPENVDYVNVDELEESLGNFRLDSIERLDNQHEDAEDASNSVADDLDLQLKQASVGLASCETTTASSSNKTNNSNRLQRDCPMLIQNEVPADWLQQHPTAAERSRMAVHCGCLLLQHKNVWDLLMKDRNIKTMSLALTNYLNANRIPDLLGTPVWAIQGWFDEAMAKFISNKKNSVKEIAKTLRSEDESLKSVISADEDEKNALELLRRGCNYIMFNYNKGSTDRVELKLIKYLDNLQLLSQDPTFVFHLALQDANLFKLHSLSKWCIPVVY